ncbi:MULTISPECIES: sensor histidine kinase [unclassified Spirosoma]|mgnify:CR=1 FL=1|uniref:sensor histidine kinase n=1 Tax=unclassified Spirosoma TaxID=2621999 RepID=UPI000967184F|nr:MULTISPECIES: sensor histidine kinase [unclassified Spirosoma]MBN8822816.1 histidine kinase [Spirosoma sp.]OJW80017.1 MAG: sensor protein lytS [Spirosoma sp. 48-14]
MKQWYKLDRYDLLVMLLSYPAIFIANYLVLGPRYFNDLALFFSVTAGITVLYVAFAWVMDTWMKYMRYCYTELDQALRRILYCLLFYVIVTVLFVCLIFLLYDWFKVPGYRYDPVIFRWTLLIGFICNLLSIGVFESIYSYQKWKESVKREYELKELHVQRQLDILKQQVNPHFLFNSLNSLVSLIGENPAQAEQFAEELSSVYRYILRASEQNLTDLTTEMTFVDSYYHLLKTRHGSGLILTVSVDKRFDTYQLPPLTLQLLLENAVKHNIVLADQPLTISIETDERAFLTVRNTLQKKQARVLSNGVGLSNILAKYQMLGQPMPTVQETDDQFVVRLPLINVTS